jgi:hypothetical protein
VGIGRYNVVSLKGVRLTTRKPALCLTWKCCSQLWVVYLYKDKNYIIYHNNIKVYNNYIKDVQKKYYPQLTTIAQTHANTGRRRSQSAML